MGGGGTRDGKREGRGRAAWEKQKARLGRVGPGGGNKRLFQPRCAISAQDHPRQADPCQRARLTIVILTTAFAQDWAELITARSDDGGAGVEQADFCRRPTLL